MMDMPKGHEGHGGMKHAGHDGQKEHAGHGGHHARMVEDFKRRFFVSLAATVPVLVLSPMLQRFTGLEVSFPGDSLALFAFSTFIYFYGGWPFLKGLLTELRAKNPGMMTLIALAITVAYGYSSAVVFGLSGKVFFWELATLIDIMLLGHWIEMRSVMGASRALEEMARLMPSEAHLVEAGGMRDVPLEELKAGDRVLVRPGEKVPADGEVVEGATTANEAMLTGESVPVEKKQGAPVIGGSVNGDGAITVEIKKTGKESFLSQVMEMVSRAQQSKSRTQDLASTAAKWLTLTALSAGAATLLAWMFGMGRGLAFSLERTVTVMVITCPHALGLAVPLVVAVSTSLAAKKGFLIRNRNSFERARKIQAVVFDKTGTLTEGRFGVSEVLTFKENMDEREVLKYAGGLESNSEHPIARGIVEAAGETYGVRDFKSIPGKGAEGTVNGRAAKVVSPGYLKEKGLEMNDERVEELSSQGKTVVFLMLEGEVAGAVALGDVIRGESREAVARLKEQGIKCMMLTGDNRAAARWVSGELGLDEYFAEVLPEQKAEKIREVQTRGLVTAMVGDGVNDAPALAQSDVGIAIGAGTDVAVETADIVLVRNNPLDAVSILGLSGGTYRKMLQNLAWATGYNAFAIPLAAGVLYNYGVLLSPALGAVLMSLSTVIVAINARLLKAPADYNLN